MLGWQEIPFEVRNEWFSGQANIRTYNIHELLGTKLRALYQRSKGRDLFDLNYARLQTSLDLAQVIQCFEEYMEFSVGYIPTQKQFLRNIELKEQDPDFIGDIEGLLRTEIEYDQEQAFEWVKAEVISKLR